MLKKYSVFTGIFVSVSLLIIGTLVYPGGSVFDKNSTGFQWSKNYISDLFEAKAVNGADSPARFLAAAAMVFLSVSIALFFINFSKKIRVRSAVVVLQYIGAGCMLFILFTVTPLHGLMVIIASSLFLAGLFYITFFIYKSKLHVFKFLCTLCLLIFYATLYLYGTANRELLPVMQKITFTASILLVLGLEYFTGAEDFEHITDKQKVITDKRSNTTI